jgi:hypothetical protein
MHGVAPHMCDQVGRPLLDRGAGGRSPGFRIVSPNRYSEALCRELRQPLLASVAAEFGIGAQHLNCLQQPGCACLGRCVVAKIFKVGDHVSWNSEAGRVRNVSCAYTPGM